MRERYPVIEFSGMPKSGKTTVMNVVSQAVRRDHSELEEFHGGGRFSPVTKENLGLLNLYLASNIVMRLSSRGFPKGISDRIYLLDRGPTDRLIFTRALRAQGRVSREHVSSIEGMFEAPEFNDAISLTFVFVTSSRLSLERENRYSLTNSDGRVMNHAMLDCLGDEARRETSHERSFRKHIELIDTEQWDGDVRGTAAHIMGIISARLLCES